MLTFLAFLFGALLFLLFAYFPVSSAALFIAASSFAVFRRKFLFVPLALLGMLCAFLRFSPSIDSLDVWNRNLRLTGRFAQAASSPAASEALTFEIDGALDPDSGKEIRELRGKEAVLFTDSDEDPSMDYEILVRTSRDRTRLCPGVTAGDRLAGSLLGVTGERKAAFSVSRMLDGCRASLNSFIGSSFDPDSAALVAAVTTGDMSCLHEDLRNAFNATGLAHLLSISGTHFGLFSVMTFAVFLFLIRRLPYTVLNRMTVYLTPSQAAALLCMPFVAGYLGISGGGTPAVRSFVMVTLFLAGLLFGRKGFWLNSVLFAAVLLVLWDPGVVLGPSFQLSFLAVFFIGFSLKGRNAEEEQGNRVLRFIRDSARLSLTASIGTSVLVAYYFHYFSVVSPLANLVVAPFIGFLLIPAALLSAFFFLTTGRYLLLPFVRVTAGWSVALVRLFAKVPLADLKIPAFPPGVCLLFYAGFLVYFLAGRKKKLLILPLAPLLLYALIHVFEKRELAITFLDVGQGDSEVIELRNGRMIVVDTGRTGRETAAFLKYRGKREIDALVLSHRHPDHCGGLGYLLSSFRVKEIWDNGRIVYPEELNHAAARRTLSRGDIVEAEDFRITVLHPYREFYTRRGNEYEEENNSSLVLKVTGRGRSFLLPGDVEEEAEEDMAHIGDTLRCDVIKMPHHGSRTSANAEFLGLVSPAVAVISAGRENPFGHPSPEVIEKLSGKRVLRTDRDGSVKIAESGGGLGISSYREFLPERGGGPSAEWRNIRRLFSCW